LFSGSGIGLYFDRNRVYVAEMRRTSRMELIRAADVPVTSEGNFPHDPALLTQAIQQAIQKAGIESRSVSAAISGPDAVVRYFEMPLIPKSEWSEAVYFEAQKYVAFSVKNLYQDYEIFPDRPQKKLSVVFVGARQDDVDKMTSWLSAAGLKVVSVEPVATALLRVLKEAQPPKSSETQALIHAQEDGELHILICKNNILLLAQDYSISKLADGSLDFDSFLSEVRLSLNYFARNFRAEAIRKAVLFAGDKGPLAEWGEKLKGEIQMPVEVINPLAAAGSKLAYSSGLVIAMGLALQKVAVGKKQTNLVPREVVVAVQKKGPMSSLEEKQMLLKLAGIEAAALVALVLVTHFIFMGSQMSFKKTVDTFRMSQAKLASLPGGMASMQELNDKEVFLTKKMGVFSSLIDKRAYLTLKMSELTKILPSHIDLTTINYQDTDLTEGKKRMQLRIEGRVQTDPSEDPLAVINQFVNNLKASEEVMRGMNQIRIASTRKLPDEGYSLAFAIECSLSDAEALTV